MVEGALETVPDLLSKKFPTNFSSWNDTSVASGGDLAYISLGHFHRQSCHHFHLTFKIIFCSGRTIDSAVSHCPNTHMLILLSWQVKMVIEALIWFLFLLLILWLLPQALFLTLLPRFILCQTKTRG